MTRTRARLAACLAALLAACTQTSVADLDVSLTDDGLSCVTSPLVTVDSITVEGIGSANGAPCLLATRCLAATGSTSVAMVEQDLMAASQPLLDVEASQLVSLRIEGHPQASCPTTRNMCGTGEVAAAVAGTLSIAMTCDDVVFTDQCNDAELPACP